MRRYKILLIAIIRSVKNQFRTSAFTCRLRSCPRATLGFENDALRREHELMHVGGFRCAVINCLYPPFPSAKSLRTHTTKVHNSSPAPKSIRRVGQIHGLTKPSYAQNNVTQQLSTRRTGYKSTVPDDQADNSVPNSRAQPMLDSFEHFSPDALDDGSTRAERAKSAVSFRYTGKIAHLLDRLFQQEGFMDVWKSLELTLSIKQSGTVITREDKEALVPPGLPDAIRKFLLDMPSTHLIITLEQACVRALRKIEEDGKIIPPNTPKSLPMTREKQTYPTPIAQIIPDPATRIAPIVSAPLMPSVDHLSGQQQHLQQDSKSVGLGSANPPMTEGVSFTFPELNDTFDPDDSLRAHDIKEDPSYATPLEMELMLLEQQNKRRLLMARDEQDEIRRRKSDGHTEPLLQTSGEFYEALQKSTEKI